MAKDNARSANVANRDRDPMPSPGLGDMAQRIWLIRHGKSSRPFGVVDHERPLSNRANDDAALILKWLDNGPRLFVTSTARRARETAALIADKGTIESHGGLYGSAPEDFIHIIEETLTTNDRVAFVGHNPTITDLVNQLAGKIVIDNVPTLGVAMFERWAKDNAPWRLVDYAAPKQLR